MNLSENRHLSKDDIIKNGSIYTPPHLVSIVKEWVSEYIEIEDVVIDFGAGYGAFISEFSSLSKRCIATDIDPICVKYINTVVPSAKVYLENSLKKISRDKYEIKKNEKIVIVGNPPYNDLTSQYKKNKKGHIEMDEMVFSRDLGVSFIKMYSMLEPEIICILHPLSYLIKKSNFNSLKFFSENYILKKGLIFSSNEFESINKKNAEFPVLLALYMKSNKNKMDFNYIKKFRFGILESKKHFCLNDFKFIENWVNKYPKKDGKDDDDLQFYTIRDINALMRNKSFLTGHCNNGIKVNLENLYKYAWLDYFKNNFKVNKMFLYGNLSPLYSKRLDDFDTRIELISYIYNNNIVVKNYIDNNNLMSRLTDHYNISFFTNQYPILTEILNSLS